MFEKYGLLDEDWTPSGRLEVVVDFCERSGYDVEYLDLKRRVEADLAGGIPVFGRMASYLGKGCFEVMVVGADLTAELSVLALEEELRMSLADLQEGFEEGPYTPEGVVVFSRLTTGVLPDVDAHVMPVLRAILNRRLSHSLSSLDPEADADGE